VLLFLVVSRCREWRWNCRNTYSCNSLLLLWIDLLLNPILRQITLVHTLVL